MDIEILREFVFLSKNLNFTETARRLNLSQSTLSNHMIKLEKDLGAELVDRSRTPRLTLAGRNFLREASSIVNTYDEAKRACRSYRRSGAPAITVQTFDAAPQPTTVILERIREFEEMHSEISFNVGSSPSLGVVESIIEGYADCGYYRPCFKEPESIEGISFVPLAHEEVLLWIDRDSELFEKEDLKIEDIEGAVMPVSVNGLGIIDEIYREMLDVFQIGASIVQCYSDSFDDFFLNKVKKGETVVTWLGTDRAVPALKLRTDKALKRFNPPIYCQSYIAFRDDPSNSALQLFRSYLAESYSDETVTSYSGFSAFAACAD